MLIIGDIMKTNYLEAIKTCLIQYLNACESYWESSVASKKARVKLENDISKLNKNIKTVTELNKLVGLIKEYNETEIDVVSAQRSLNNLKVNSDTIKITKEEMLEKTSLIKNTSDILNTDITSAIRKEPLAKDLSDVFNYFTETIAKGNAKKFELKNKIFFTYELIKNGSSTKVDYNPNVTSNINTCIKINTYELISATNTLINTINNTPYDINLENISISKTLNINLASIVSNIKQVTNEVTNDINDISTNILNYINTLTGEINSVDKITPTTNIKYDFSSNSKYTTKTNINNIKQENTTVNSTTSNNNDNNTIYTVQSGDSLSLIAKKHYGDPNKYNIIYEANKGLIGNNPNIIRVGQELIIPGITATTTVAQTKSEPVEEVIIDQTENNSTNKIETTPITPNNTTLQDRTIAGMKEKDAQNMTVPNDINTNFKSYTKYTAVTKKTDNNGNYVMKQSAILYGDRPDSNGIKYNTYTDSDTHVRCVDINNEKYYCVAMGDYYGNVGDTFNITTSEGNNFNVIVCDAKGKDSTAYLDIASQKVIGHKQGSNNMSIIEFYYDGAAGLPSDMLVRGGSTGTFNSVPKFKGNISKVLKTSTYESYASNNVL